jgi:hypothetical protein
MSRISIKDYEELFYYDISSPTFLRWKIDCYSGKGYKIKHVLAGDPAGSLNGTEGYSQIHYKRNMYRVHRIIFEMFNGEISKDYIVDHIDGNPKNNCITNLRAVEKKFNSQNKKKQCNNSSGIVGVVPLFYKNPKGVVYKYYKAEWSNNGKKEYKIFSVLKLGDSEAFDAACKYRVKMIEELNTQGAGYTERHGK